MNNLIKKIEDRAACVIVLGLGYVGLPLAMEIAKSGFKTIGVEKDERKLKSLNQGNSYITDIEDSELRRTLRKEDFTVNNNLSRMEKADLIVICVPTPLNKNKEPDMSHIVYALDDMIPFIGSKQLIILESTTYPGTTEEIIQWRLEREGFKIGRDVYLAYSPERIDPGNKKYSFSKIPKVVSGVTPQCRNLAKAFYQQIVQEVYSVTSPKVAEMEKIFENIFRNVNIALVNELVMLCDRMGIDCWEVINAAKTKPYGFLPFYPGPGVGGHCIPIDPLYLSWKAREYDFATKFIDLAAEINSKMPNFIVSKIVKILNQNKKCLNGSKVLILGMAYKKNISDIRRSPALRIMEELLNEGANVCYHDPYDPTLKRDKATYKSLDLNKRNLNNMDIVVITTDHSDVDYEFIAAHSDQILDTRNVYNNKQNYRANIWTL